MSAPDGSSLRDLYNKPSQSWSFVPSTDDLAKGTPPTSATTPADLASTSYAWSGPARANAFSDIALGLDLAPSQVYVSVVLRGLATSALLQFLSTAIEIPWEVGKTLLQVQYVPKDAVSVEDAEVAVEEEEVPSEDDFSGDNEEAYFADEDGSTSRVNTPRPTDDRGYVIRQNLSDISTKADYVIPLGTVDGVWSMMKQVGRWKPEGWLSLWKGLGVSVVQNLLASSMQPIIRSSLVSLSDSLYRPPSVRSYSRRQNIFIPVASHLFTQFLLSPLDLIRTRLIVQTTVPRHRRYTGPIDAFKQILQYEGGLYGMYLHPQLFFPTILDCTLAPLVDAMAPRLTARFLSRLLGMNPSSPIAEDTYPILWAFSQLVGSFAGLLITVPIETIRRRLQAQMRGNAAPLSTCVEVRRRPYVGVVDCAYSIMVEERSDLPLRPKRRRRRGSKAGKEKEGVDAIAEASVEEKDNDVESWSRSSGLGQLYRGLGMRIGASITIFLLQLLVPTTDADDGWTEL